MGLLKNLPFPTPAPGVGEFDVDRGEKTVKIGFPSHAEEAWHGIDTLLKRAAPSRDNVCPAPETCDPDTVASEVYRDREKSSRIKIRVRKEVGGVGVKSKLHSFGFSVPGAERLSRDASSLDCITGKLLRS